MMEYSRDERYEIGVIGLGKLGLPLASILQWKGHSVTGVDASASTVSNLRRGRLPINEPGMEALYEDYPLDLVTMDATSLAGGDATFIVVPTPSGSDGRFINGFLLAALQELGGGLSDTDNPHVVVVCSTVMPGTSDAVLIPALEEASGRTVGEDGFGFCYNPEFIALGTVLRDMCNPDIHLIGQSDIESGAIVENILHTMLGGNVNTHVRDHRYRENPYMAGMPKIGHGAPRATEPTPYHGAMRMSTTEAEIAKIAINAYVTMKISCANTIGEMSVGRADAYKIAQALGADSRIGPKYIQPGASFGGPCFPRDSVAFQKAAEDVGTTAPLAIATDEVNHRQARVVVDWVEALAMEEEVETVCILGMSYKPGTHIDEESFGWELDGELAELGYYRILHDPLVQHPEVLNGDVPRADAYIVATMHPQYKELSLDAAIIDPWTFLYEATTTGRYIATSS